MKSKFQKRGHLIKGLILALAVIGTVVIVGALAPNVFQVVGPIVKKWNKKQINRAFQHLKKQELIFIRDNADGSTSIELSEKGRKRILEFKLDEIKIKPMKKWDNKWRFVTYDIPDKFRNISNALSRKLKDLGFCKFQKNFWVHPFPIKDEIDFVCEIFNAGRFIRTGEISRLEDDELLRKKFHL